MGCGPLAYLQVIFCSKCDRGIVEIVWLEMLAVRVFDDSDIIGD